MYIWIGAVFPKEFEDKIRNICKQVNQRYNVSELAFILPQHISLKLSFQSTEYKKIIEYLEDYLQDYTTLYVKTKNIYKKENSLIWLNVEKSNNLISLHNNLNKELQDKFDSLMYEITKNIKSNGFFVGNFLGKKDGWYGNETMTFLSKEKVLSYFKDFEIKYYAEKKYVKDTVIGGKKNWHLFEIMAMKK